MSVHSSAGTKKSQSSDEGSHRGKEVRRVWERSRVSSSQQVLLPEWGAPNS
jgi:hypothetical protein